MPIFAALLEALGPWIARFVMAKGVLMLAGFLARLGIVIATDKFAIAPLIQLVISKWQAIPPQMLCWLSLFGVTKAVSILLSAATLIAAKKVFFKKTSNE